MTKSWEDIEAMAGFEGAQAFAHDKIEPLLEAETKHAIAPGDNPIKGFQMPLLLAFVLTIIAQNLILSFLPNGWLRSILFFAIFPLLFIGILLFMVRLFKDRIVSQITRAKASLISRTKAMRSIADFLGFTYIPIPGGAPNSLKSFSKWLGNPEQLQALITTLEEKGGLESALDTAIKSGVMISNTIIVAKAENKQKLIRTHIEMQNLQDGFIGTHAGIPFEAFEWVERPSETETANTHHLVMVLPAPARLHGVTQLRTRKIAWPYSGVDHAFKTVDVNARDFTDIFKIRSTDQVEARQVFNPAVMERVLVLAGKNAVRAVAFSDGLVLDIVGRDRFAISEITTGTWSRQSVHDTFSDIAALLQLVEATAHSFMLPKVPDA